MKLSDAMREKMLLSFELFPPKTDKGMENLPGTIEHLCKSNQNIFPVHTVPAEQTLVKTWTYVK